jgi:hypothetical protein
MLWGEKTNDRDHLQHCHLVPYWPTSFAHSLGPGARSQTDLQDPSFIVYGSLRFCRADRSMFRQSITMRNWDSIGYNWIAIIAHNYSGLLD